MIDSLLNSFRKLDELSSNMIQYVDSNLPFDDENNLQDLIDFYNHHFEKSKNDMKIIIQILVSIYKDNYTQNNTMIPKILEILDFLKPKIKENFSESEIFNFFKMKKRLLLYIYENEMITKQYFDKELMNYYDSIDFLQFFYIELRDLNREEFEYKIQLFNLESFVKENDKNKELFIERRRKGENESKLSKIIREDLFDDFTSLVSQSNLDLNSTIEKSFFEPIFKNEDDGLIDPTLIEYAAYYGSHTIFKYLFMKDVKITKNLFWFSIHGRNYEIIHLIEKQQKEEDLIDCYNEAIKLHYNEIAAYIEETYLKEKKIPFSSIEYCIRSFNIQMMIRILENNEKIFKEENNFNKFFFYLCECGYTDIVDLILKNSNTDFLKARDSQISKKINFFFMIFNFNIFFNEIFLSIHFNWTALHFATFGLQLDIVKILLEKSQELLNLKDLVLNYIYFKIIFDFNILIRNFLIYKLANWNPLHIAVSKNNLEIVSFLLSQKNIEVDSKTDIF